MRMDRVEGGMAHSPCTFCCEEDGFALCIDGGNPERRLEGTCEEAPPPCFEACDLELADATGAAA